MAPQISYLGKIFSYSSSSFCLFLGHQQWPCASFDENVLIFYDEILKIYALSQTRYTVERCRHIELFVYFWGKDQELACFKWANL